MMLSKSVPFFKPQVFNFKGGGLVWSNFWGVHRGRLWIKFIHLFLLLNIYDIKFDEFKDLFNFGIL